MQLIFFLIYPHTEEKHDGTNLVLEVTRRCNIRCGHCLRGDVLNLDMPNELIERLLSMTDTIGSVTFI